jgi:ubiquinone/menaquinone biosynthesis C-methylase UbiE
MPDHGRVCPWWLAWTFDNPLRRWLHDPRRILGVYVKEAMTVADIGCGMGYFSVAMAQMVGPRGRVLAVDVQAMMLRFVRKRALSAGVADRIETILASEDDIRIASPLDFALAFWVIHEVRDVPRFFAQVAAVLKPGGKLLYTEPDMHVTPERFAEIVAYARNAGFGVIEEPRVRWSRAVALARQAPPSVAGRPGCVRYPGFTRA